MGRMKGGPGPQMKVVSFILTLIFLLPLLWGIYSVIETGVLENNVSAAVGYVIFLVVVLPLFYSLIRWSVHLREKRMEDVRKESAPRVTEVKRMLYLIRKSPLALAGIIIIMVLVSVALLAPVIAPEHWDPKNAEIPLAQRYFKFLPPSMEVKQQYDLYAKHVYTLYPEEGGADITIDSAGNASLGVNASFRYGLYQVTASNASVARVHVLPEQAVLDRVEIYPQVTSIPPGGPFRLGVRALSTQGTRMDAFCTWSVGNDLGYISRVHDREVLFHPVAPAGSRGDISVECEYGGVLRSAVLQVDISPSTGPWEISSMRLVPESSISLVEFPKSISVEAYAENGTPVPETEYNVSWGIGSRPGTSDDLYTIRFASTKRGWAAGANGSVLRTLDGGLTWNRLPPPAQNVTLYGMSFVSTTKGWLAGSSGRIFYTGDGGISWTEQNSTVNVTLRSILFTNDTSGWAVGDGGTLVRTSDVGLTWTVVPSGVNADLHDISFYGSRGLVVGDGGTVIRTVDGGTTWTAVPAGLGTRLMSVQMTDNNTAYAVGANGTIIKSSDGGLTWSRKAPGGTSDLHAVRVGKSEGFACGSGGQIFRTADSGESWELQSTNITEDLYSLGGPPGTSVSSMFAVGGNGVMLNLRGGEWARITPWLTNLSGNRTDIISYIPGEVTVTASVTSRAGVQTFTSRIYVVDGFVILDDRIPATPSDITIRRGETFHVNLTLRDELGNPITDGTFRWMLSGGVMSLDPDEAEIRGDSPSSTERITYAGARQGLWRGYIVNHGETGPFYFRVLGHFYQTDPVNLTRERVDRFLMSTGENMEGDPLKPDEKRTFEFTLDEGLDILNIDLVGPKPYLLGTDEAGRDYLSLILYGTGISMKIAIVVVVTAVLIGTLLGGVSGYLGGKIDELIMRVTDVFLSVPGLILAMGVAAVLGRSLDNIMYALIVVWWPGYTRLVRGQALSVRENLYVEAARAVGSSESRIVAKHILPNCLSPVLVAATLDIGAAVLVAAGLGFIGFGALFPTPELGLLISTGRQKVFAAPWLITFPGLAIFLFVLGFNLFGDGLRDLLDPRLRE